MLNKWLHQMHGAVCLRRGWRGWKGPIQEVPYQLVVCVCVSLRPIGRLTIPPTQGVAMSMALFGGVCVKDICTVESLSMPCPFIRFYHLGMLGSFSGSVLAVGYTEVVKVVKECTAVRCYCT